LLGGLAVMLAWGRSDAEQVPDPLTGHLQTGQMLRELEKALHDTEDAYRLAVAELNDVAVEHALHRQAVATFLARHFRDLGAESMRGEASTIGSTTPTGIPSQSAIGWGPRRPNYFVTTEGPSAIYELPTIVSLSREPKSNLNEQQRYHQLEAAAHASADQLERAVHAERKAWARAQEAVSLYRAALDVRGTENQTHGDSRPVPTPSDVSASKVSIPIGLAVVTVLAPVAGYVFVRKATPLGGSEPRIAARASDVSSELRLPVLGILRAPSALIAESSRRLSARLQLYNRVDHGRFASEAVVGGALLLWAMLALLQPGFADRFFDQPADAVAEVASRL
jgi:hypothetical protein